MKNHLNETIYQTYQGWKRACKAKAKALEMKLHFRGNKNIGAAYYLDSSNQVNDIGEWDGCEGTIFNP